jgi:hypothetical protein
MWADRHWIALGSFAIGALVTLLLVGAAPSAGARSKCSPKPPRQTRLVHVVPPRSLLAGVAELRRQQVDRDRLAPDTLRAYRESYTAISVDYVRLLHTSPDGRKFYLIPATFYYPFVPDRCFRRLSTRVRRQALRDQRHARAYSRRLALGIAFTQSKSHGANVSGTATRANASDLRQGRSVAAFGRGPNGPSLVFGIVPDGVDVVVLRYLHRWHHFQAAHNFWSADVRESASSAVRNPTVWETNSGRVIARFRSPQKRLVASSRDRVTRLVTPSNASPATSSLALTDRVSLPGARSEG